MSGVSEKLPLWLRKGPISWMARNSVAANLLMTVLIVGGLAVATQVKQEVFPEFDLDYVSINVVYPGASPAEVEKGIVLAIEEAVRGVDGVKKVTSSATEGRAGVYVELLLNAEKTKALQDIKNEVDRIQSFPEEAEEPIVSLLASRREVISLVLYGDQTEMALREIAERMRDDLLSDVDITQVDLYGVRPLEISIEVPELTLRQFNLTLQQVASVVRNSAVELPGGAVDTPSGEVLLRMAERRDLGSEFGDIEIVTTPDGTPIRLADIATIKDGFEDVDIRANFDGKPAVMVRVFRIGDQTPIEVADAVKKYRDSVKAELPPGVFVETWNDNSRIYRERIDLLVRNAQVGLILVLIILGLFLELRLAFWVTMGIPISFLGSFLLIPAFDVSINMISLFAFIVTLGMVVDDAIVVGENIYEATQRGESFLRAAIRGAKQVATPVTFSILTTITAFSPMLFVPGVSGKLFRNIPVVVIAVLLISLFESLFVLPAHLSHLKAVGDKGIWPFIHRQQQKVGALLDWFIRRVYGPTLNFFLNHRYFSGALGVATLSLTIGFIGGGHIDFTFLPKVESDIVVANAKLPFGAPAEDTIEVETRLLNAAREVLAEYSGETHNGIYSQLGQQMAGRGPVNVGGQATGSHITGVQVQLVPSAERNFTAEQFSVDWRNRVGQLSGLDSLSFSYTTGPSGGAAIDLQLIHPDVPTLEAAAADVAKALADYPGVKDIDPGFSNGKPQLDFAVNEYGRSMGLTAQSVAAQVRSAYFGAEALRQQRGRNEVKVYARLPESERLSQAQLDSFKLLTPEGSEVPLRLVTERKRGVSYTSIERSDAQRVLSVTADVDLQVTSVDRVLRDVTATVLPAMGEKYPGLKYGLEGEQRDRNESLTFLGFGFLLALLLMYGLLAIPFKSYVQPVIVMAAIPFGIVGALIGHVVLGFNLSIISMMGIVALSGVVVNDSLVLIDAANRYRREGQVARKAIHAAGIRRFRPILLTSLTTFFGLMPMIFEQSVQARFLIPMAISLGFGVLFATFIILVLVPSFYMIVEDALDFMGLPSPIPEFEDEEAEEEDEEASDVALTPRLAKSSPGG